MWYNRLSEYLLTKRYTNQSKSPCFFISRKEFDIIDIHVDDINIIGAPEELPKAINCLKEMV